MVLGSRFTEKQLTKVVFQEELVFLFYCSTESVNETNIYGSNFWISCYQSRSNYDFCTQLSKRLSRARSSYSFKKKKLRINEISVNMQERQGGQSSITPLKSAYYMIKVSLAILMQKS